MSDKFKRERSVTGYRSKRLSDPAILARAAARSRSNAINRAHYEALDRQAVATMPFQPYKLTWALDIHDLYDPEPSEALGTPVGLVDRWEEGLEDPTPEQAAALVAVTGYPLRWFWCVDRPLEMTHISHVGPADPVIALGRSRWKIGRDRPDAYRLMLGGGS